MPRNPLTVPLLASNRLTHPQPRSLVSCLVCQSVSMHLSHFPPLIYLSVYLSVHPSLCVYASLCLATVCPSFSHLSLCPAKIILTTLNLDVPHITPTRDPILGATRCTGTRRTVGRGAASCLGGKSSAWPSRGPSFAIPHCCFSTKPPRSHACTYTRMRVHLPTHTSTLCPADADRLE
jgi:hypothetical protein